MYYLLSGIDIFLQTISRLLNLLQFECVTKITIKLKDFQNCAKQTIFFVLIFRLETGFN